MLKILKFQNTYKKNQENKREGDIMKNISKQRERRIR